MSSFPLRESVEITITETNKAYKPVIITSSPDTSIGDNRGPIPMESVASTMQLPMASPIAISISPLRKAVNSTTSSGREVPNASMKKLRMYSGMLKIVDREIAY